MCGIAGKVYFDPARCVEREVLECMNAVQAHRGPDDAGISCQGPVGLAHRRLSIIDVSPAGHQPMANEDGTVWIVFNGEIYNFQELRSRLAARGHQFRSRTDTEVILHLYEEYGVACLEFLRGMFAFAIWDAPRRQLFLARDRLGVKPLTYQQDAQAFWFASEAKAILQDPAVRREPDLPAISHYLTFGYVPNPLSAFRGVRQLPPGHALTVQDGALKVWRWWELARGYNYGPSYQETREAILCLLREATACRLMADVPIGVLLSGGVDSSAVVWAMREAGVRAETFCMGFADAAFDERDHAWIVAQRLDTRHHEFEAILDSATMLPTLAETYDEPFGDSSAIPTYLLAKEVRKHVTVVLTGDGGDEAFGGYRRYVLQRAAQRMPFAPSEADTYAIPFCVFTGDRWDAITTADFQHAAGGDGMPWLRRVFSESLGINPTDRAMDVDTRLYLPDDLCVKMDRATMAHGLEARSPFLDHRFLEYAATIPSGAKVGWGLNKRILKRALRGHLPDQILDRPKMGFGVPLSSWLRGPLREPAQALLTSRRFIDRGWFRPRPVHALLAGHLSGRQDAATPLWYLLMLELWACRWLNGGRSCA